MALNAKQRRFVDEYLIDLNATQAAIRAGYSLSSTVPESGFYCYFLIDPRDGKVFYVGKGKGNRVHSHARLAKTGAVDNAQKFKRITDIFESGYKVLEVVFSAHEVEGDAFSVERHLILSLSEHGITNIAGGVVTNDQKSKEQAKFFVARIRPFEEWHRQLGPEREGQVRRVFGSPLEFYKAFCAQMSGLAT